MRRSTLPAALLALTLTLSACGDDDTTSSATNAPADSATIPDKTVPTTSSAPPATEAAPDSTPDTTVPSATDASAEAGADVCAVAEEINSSGAPPTLEQMEQYLAAAPPDLQPAVEAVIAAVTAADGNFMAIFEDPDAAVAIEQITAFEAEACGMGEASDQDPSATEIDETATRIDVVATEYAYEVDLPATPGRYSFVMQNEGAEPHIMILFRLEDGAELGAVLEAEGEEGIAEEFESSPAVPGGEGVLTADLGPGNWVLICPIPGPEGHPHFVDGMINEFTIT